MTTDARINLGRDFNFFQKSTITDPTFSSTQPTFIITFPVQGFHIYNEGSGVVEYSFNGNTVHGELDSTKDSKTIRFENRSCNKVWFRLKSGSSIIVRLDAWGIR